MEGRTGSVSGCGRSWLIQHVVNRVIQDVKGLEHTAVVPSFHESILSQKIQVSLMFRRGAGQNQGSFHHPQTAQARRIRGIGADFAVEQFRHDLVIPGIPAASHLNPARQPRTRDL
jgi:hypothetical protein